MMECHIPDWRETTHSERAGHTPWRRLGEWRVVRRNARVVTNHRTGYTSLMSWTYRTTIKILFMWSNLTKIFWFFKQRCSILSFIVTSVLLCPRWSRLYLLNLFSQFGPFPLVFFFIISLNKPIKLSRNNLWLFLQISSSDG